ncbi:MAG: TSUP family transporter, partial [Microbacteriaceae bacterium]
MPEIFLDSPWLLFGMLFAAGLFAGWIDAVVGGGGLIQLPALLLVPGLTPVEALATNKFGSIFGTAASSTTYYLKLKPSPRFFLPMAGIAGIGAYLGAILASRIPGELFLPIILLILVAVLIVTLARPKLGHVQKEPL